MYYTCTIQNRASLDGSNIDSPSGSKGGNKD